MGRKSTQCTKQREHTSNSALEKVRSLKIKEEGRDMEGVNMFPEESKMTHLKLESRFCCF